MSQPDPPGAPENTSTGTSADEEANAAATAESATESSESISWNYWTGPIVVVAVTAGLVAGHRFGLLDELPELTVDRSKQNWWILSLVLTAGALGLAISGTLSRGAAGNPRDWLKGKTWRLWIVLAVLVVPTAVFGGWARLASGDNIVLFELAGTQSAAATLEYPGDPVFDAALRGDIGFLVGYALVLFLLVRWSGAYYRLGPVRGARIPLSWAAFAAAAADCLENYCLYKAQLGMPSPGQSQDIMWPLAATFAYAKFAVLVLLIVFVIGGVWTWMFTPRWVREASWALRRPIPDSADGFDKATVHRVRETPFGIALSGGGIRASSISLGALQVLENDDDEQPNLGWDTASVVTAVSGGSNMGSGWSFARSEYETEKYGFKGRGDVSALDPRPWKLDDNMTPEEKHLFANLGYLLASSPRGTAGNNDAPMSSAQVTSDNSAAGKAQRYRPSAIATALTGITINIVVFIVALWILVTPLGWMLAWLNGQPLESDGYQDLISSHYLWFPGVVVAGAGVFLIMVWVLLGQVRFLSRSLNNDAWRQRLFTACRVGGYSLVALGAVLLILLAGMPLLAGWLNTGGPKSFLTTAAGGAAVLGSVGRILKKPGAKYAPYLGGIAFAVFAILVAANWVGLAAETASPWSLAGEEGSRLPWLSALMALIAIQVAISPERWSLAAFYRGKLRIGYSTYRNGAGEVEAYENDTNTKDLFSREPWLHSFRRKDDPARVSTPFTICAAATVSSRTVKTHYAVPALSVTFDPRFVSVHVPMTDIGTWAVHQAPTEVINAMGDSGRKRLTTMLAVAISSAAVSPAMGRVRIGPTRMLLAFANARLGVWMPNPRYVDAYLNLPGADAENMSELSYEARKAKKIGYPRTGLSYLFREFFGIHDMSDPYLYMTDGGHWENTGLVELLRRKDIKEIFCIDADCGSLEATTSLGKALDLAPLECGVRVQIGLDPLRAKLDSAGATYAERTVTVGFFRQESDWDSGIGVLWYAKPGLSADMSTALLGFRETHPDFPVISTADQLFDSSTYIAYRELGRHNARRIRKARKALIAFIADLSIPADPTEDEEAAILAQLYDDAVERHWVVRELANATLFIPTKHRVEFLSAVARVLEETNRQANAEITRAERAASTAAAVAVASAAGGAW